MAPVRSGLIAVIVVALAGCAIFMPIPGPTGSMGEPLPEAFAVSPTPEPINPKVVRAELGEAVAKEGMRLVGHTSLSHDGQPIRFDCSGLVKSLFSKFKIELPRSAQEQFKQGEKVDRDKLEAGDLVFFSDRKSTRLNSSHRT